MGNGFASSLAVFLGAGVILTLTLACNGNDSENDTDSETDTQTQTETETGTSTDQYCGQVQQLAGTCDISAELQGSDLVLEEVPFSCPFPPLGAAQTCDAEAGVECFFGQSEAFVFVFSSTEAVTSLIGDACLDIPFDIDWTSERIVVAGVMDGTCGVPLVSAHELYTYTSGGFHLDLYLWDSGNPWDEGTDCDSATAGGLGLRLPTSSTPTVCLHKSPPCAE